MYCPGWEIVSVLDKNVALGGLPRAVSLCFFQRCRGKDASFYPQDDGLLGCNRFIHLRLQFDDGPTIRVAG
jgi:hypothetical protein